MRVEIGNTTGGWRGTSRTIRAMHRLVREGRADPTIIYAASRLARRVGDKDYAAQARACHEFVQRSIAYTRDPVNVELVRSPFWTLYYGAGDCDDQAILFSALCQALGFRTRFKTIKADPTMPNEYSHVYSEVQVPGRGWVPADTIVRTEPFGWEAAGVGGGGGETWEDKGMFGGLGADDIVLVNDPQQTAASGGQTSWWQQLLNVGKQVATDYVTAVANKEIMDVQADIYETQARAKAAAAGLAPKKGVADTLAPYAPLLVMGGVGALAFIILMRKR